MVSHTVPPSPSRADSISEHTPLLSRARSSDRGLASLKRKSARVSDLISGGSHSAANWWPQGEDLEPGHLHNALQENDTESGSIRTARSIRGYDGEFRTELQGEAGNGVRQWYDNFMTIDWIHDAIKDSLRRRRLRNKKRTEGIRGLLANLWDGSQGWILATCIGVCTAAIAFMIISFEMLLFDLKDGYCQRNVRLAKRFCCGAVDISHPGVTEVPRALTLRHGRHGSYDSFSSSFQRVCTDWRPWVEVYQNWTGSGPKVDNIVKVSAYALIALAFSTTASFLTLTLTRSDSVYSSKDAAGDPHPGFSTQFPRPQSITPTDSSTSAASIHGDESKVHHPTSRPRKVLFFAAGSGIPEIKCILSGFVIRGYLGGWTLVTKSVGLTLSVASGLSLGKEGPFVHIASCVASILSRALPKYDRNEAKRREIISAGCAAGVAVSFGAPIGGTLFSLEEVSYFFPPRTMIRSFWAAMIAAITLKLLDPFGSGKIVLFAVTYDRDWHTLELLGYLFLGAFGGIYGAMFCKANIWWTKHVRNGTFLKRHPIVDVALITLITVAISFYNPLTKMGGTELIFELFSECHIDSKNPLCIDLPEQVRGLTLSILYALIAKALLTVVTFGIKLPAGIFIPTLAVGACAGRIAGLLVELLHARHPTLAIFNACRAASETGPLPFGQSCVLPGVWAMIGAASTLAGVTRTTISLAVIMFELTGSLTYTVPVMLGVLTAKTVADALEPRGIYDLVIEIAELPYLDAKVEYIHEQSPADILDSNAPVISIDDDNTLDSLRDKLVALYESGSGGGFPIVGSCSDEVNHHSRGESRERSHPHFHQSQSHMSTAAREEDRHERGGPVRMYGYIASKELEHGLAQAGLGLSATGTTPCTFRVASAIRNGQTQGLATVMQSTVGTPAGVDLSWLVDSAPLTVNSRAPMELCHELFIKLGVRYIVVVDEKGLYAGVIDKVRYLGYLKWMEKSKHNKSS